MGWKVNEKCKAVCPLYEDVIRTANGVLAGVQCSFCSGVGLEVHTIIRCKDYKEARKLKAKFCDSIRNYEQCPYYKLWITVHENGRR